MKTYKRLVEEALKIIPEVMPWDLEDELLSDNPPLLLDIREPHEFDLMGIKDSIHVPRGVLESACEWGYDDTVPALAANREQNIVVICRSGKRSALAALTMTQLGFTKVRSLAMGIKGWNDNDLEMVNQANKIVDGDEIDMILNQPVSQDKQNPND